MNDITGFDIENRYTEFLKARIKELEEDNKKLRSHIDALVLDIAFMEREKNDGKH